MLSPVIFVEDLRDDLLNPNPFDHKDDPDPWTAWAVADENVEYSISIYRGRSSVTEAPQSSTMNCSFVLSELNATTFDGIQIGSRIRFSLADGGEVVTDRFTGRITDQ